MNAALNDPASSPDERVAALLLQRGKLKDADLVRARRLQEQDGGGLLALLGRLGLVSERDHAEACAAELDLPLRSARDVPELPPEDVALSLKFMKQYHVVPVSADATHVDVLVADPQDAHAADAGRLGGSRGPRPAAAAGHARQGLRAVPRAEAAPVGALRALGPHARPGAAHS